MRQQKASQARIVVVVLMIERVEIGNVNLIRAGGAVRVVFIGDQRPFQRQIAHQRHNFRLRENAARRVKPDAVVRGEKIKEGRAALAWLKRAGPLTQRAS